MRFCCSALGLSSQWFISSCKEKGKKQLFLRALHLAAKPAKKFISDCILTFTGKKCMISGVVRLRRVAQLGRALRSGRRGRRFESCHADGIMVSYINVNVYGAIIFTLLDFLWERAVFLCRRWNRKAKCRNRTLIL